MKNRYIVINYKLIPEDTAPLVLEQLMRGREESPEHLVFSFDAENINEAVSSVKRFMENLVTAPFNPEFVIEMVWKMSRINNFDFSVMELELYLDSGIMVIRKSDS